MPKLSMFRTGINYLADQTESKQKENTNSTIHNIGLGSPAQIASWKLSDLN